MNNDEYLKLCEDRVKKINNELEIRKNPTDPLLKQCCKCKQVNRTKYNRWLCPYCGYINELSDKIEDIRKIIVRWLQGILVVSIFVGLIIFGWQIYNLLKLGYWIDMPLVTAFRYIGINLTPIYYPTDWHGVAKVARWFLGWPLSISLPIITLILTWILKVIVQYDSSKE